MLTLSDRSDPWRLGVLCFDFRTGYLILVDLLLFGFETGDEESDFVTQGGDEVGHVVVVVFLVLVFLRRLERLCYV